MISLTDILEGVAGQNSILGKVMDEVAAQTQKLGQLGQEQKQAKTDEATAAVTVQQAVDQESMRDEANNNAFAKAVGINTQDPSADRRVQLGAFMSQKYDEAQVLLEKIRTEDNTSIFDNPVEWLKGKLNGGATIAEYNQVRNQYNAANAALEGINSNVQSVVKTDQDLSSTVTAGVMQARSNAILAKARSEAAQIDIATAQFNIAGAKELASMSQQQLSNNMNAYNAVATDAQRKAMDEDRNAALQMRLDAAKEKASKNQEDDDTANTIRIGLRTMGMNDAANLPTIKLVERLIVQGKQVPLIRTAFEIGMNRELTGTPMIGNTPEDTADYLSKYNIPVPKAQQPIKDMMGVALANTQQAVQIGQVNAKDGNSVRSYVRGQIDLYADNSAALIKPGDFSNIYQAPDMKSIAALPGIQNLPLYAKILKPQITSGMTTTDPQKIFDLAIAGVNNGQLTTKEAMEGLQVWMSAATKVNNVVKDYTRYNLPTQSSYRTPIHTGVGATGTFDLANYGDAAKAVMKGLAAVRDPAGRETSLFSTDKFVNAREASKEPNSELYKQLFQNNGAALEPTANSSGAQ